MDKRVVTFLIKAKQATYAGKGAETSPSREKSHDLIYRDGDFDWFQGKEIICHKDLEIYECVFHGGLIE